MKRRNFIQAGMGALALGGLGFNFRQSIDAAESKPLPAIIEEKTLCQITTELKKTQSFVRDLGWQPFAYNIYNVEDPHTENRYVFDYTPPSKSYGVPAGGRYPESSEGDRVVVPMVEYTKSIDWFINDNDDIGEVTRCMQVGVRDMHLQQWRDNWHTVMACGNDRNRIVVFDCQNEKRILSGRFVSLLKTIVRRGGTGSPTDIVIGKDLYNKTFGKDSPRESVIYGVTVHPLTELNIGAHLHEFYIGALHGTFPNDGTWYEHLVIALDCRTNGIYGFQNWAPNNGQAFQSSFHNENSRRHLKGRNSISFSMKRGTVTLYPNRVLLGAV